MSGSEKIPALEVVGDLGETWPAATPGEVVVLRATLDLRWVEVVRAASRDELEDRVHSVSFEVPRRPPAAYRALIAELQPSLARMAAAYVSCPVRGGTVLERLEGAMDDLLAAHLLVDAFVDGTD